MKALLFLYFHVISLISSSIIEFNLTPIKKSIHSNDIIIDWNNTSEDILWSILTKIQSNNLFTIEIELGTPGQTLNVLIDTGSFLLWVAKENSKDAFPLPNHFKPFKSSTYKNLNKPFNLQYVTGKCTGELSDDYLNIYGQLLKMEWGLASETYSNFECDGIIGFGRHFYSQPYSDTQNLISRLIEEKKAVKHVFSMKIDSVDMNNSKMFVGDYHDDFKESNKNHIGYCNLKVSQHWTCRLSHVVFGDSSIENFKENAVSFYYDTIFDSGSNRILFPMKTFNQFANHFPKDICKETFSSEYTGLICQERPNLPDISFVFNGYSIRLNSLSLFEEIQSRYLFIILFWDQPLFIIGMPFFYNGHLLFDNELSQMRFYVDDLKNIKNVSQFTTDDDFFLTDHPLIIMAIVISSLVVICIVIGLYFYFRNKKQRELAETLLPYNKLILT